MKRFVTIFLLILFTAPVVLSQTRADKLFDRGDYLGALKLYRKELEAGTGDKERTKMRLANCFFHMNDVVRAGQFYKEVDPGRMEAEDLLYYAITLQRSGEYDKAMQYADMVEEMGGDAVATDRLRQSCQFAQEMKKEKPTYAANKTKVNFAGFSSGVTYFKGKGIILAAPGTGENALQDSKGYKFTRLYNAVFAGDGTSGRLIPFAEELVDKYHIGAVTFTKDLKRIYYTKTILKPDGTSILKLMTAENVNGKWESIKELNINSDDYSCAHPSLYHDSLLFFVSDMPGGYGGKDVYKSIVDGEECGEVQNLGAVVNTEDDELFPYVDDEGTLFFASAGHIGLGGLDVFESHPVSDDEWSEPVNMGRPINSSMDDFGLVFSDTKRTEGYVSSNRGDTGYNDYLFALKLLPNKTPKVKVEEEPKVVVKADEMFKVDYRYAVQVGAFRNPVPRVYFDKFANVKVYLGFDNIYRYTVGEYPEEQLAANDMQLVRHTVSDAFVVDVNRYVAERKIRNGIEGDKVTDDELLLIRLKNLEAQKRARQARQAAAPQQTKRYLDKPQNEELRRQRSGYTIVLMSADRTLNLSKFNGIRDIDVYDIEGGGYRYCTGSYSSMSEAERALQRVMAAGFRGAYVSTIDAVDSGSDRLADNRGARRESADKKDVGGMRNLLQNL